MADLYHLADQLLGIGDANAPGDLLRQQCVAQLGECPRFLLILLHHSSEWANLRLELLNNGLWRSDKLKLRYILYVERVENGAYVYMALNLFLHCV